MSVCDARQGGTEGGGGAQACLHSDAPLQSKWNALHAGQVIEVEGDRRDGSAVLNEDLSLSGTGTRRSETGEF